MAKEISTSYKTGKVLTGADAILERFEIACLMNVGEFSPTPWAGIGLSMEIDEGNTPTTHERIKRKIISVSRSSFPEIKVLDIEIGRIRQRIKNCNQGFDCSLWGRSNSST